jgi:hypothetical protein
MGLCEKLVIFRLLKSQIKVNFLTESRTVKIFIAQNKWVMVFHT